MTPLTFLLSLLTLCFTANGGPIVSKPHLDVFFPRVTLNLTAVEVQALKEQGEFFEKKAKEEAKFENLFSKNTRCGRSNALPFDRIVGGVETNVGEFPWQAGLIISESKDYFRCAGSLISSEWVLTAAHCVEGASRISVLLGSRYSSTNVTDANRQVYTSSKFFIDPTWSAQNLSGDIALIQLPSPISFTDYIQPICLPSAYDSDHVNDSVVATGWGLTSENVTIVSPVLMKVGLNVTSMSSCSEIYGHFVTDDIICTDGSKGRGPCRGDSGGPLHFEEPDGSNSVIGIVSFGSAKCQQGFPTAYTRVSSYLQWIYFITGIESTTATESNIAIEMETTTFSTTDPTV